MNAMTENLTPRGSDVILSHRMLEALRDAAIVQISREIPNLRQGDDHRRADTLRAAVTTLRTLDLNAVLGDLLAAPVPEEIKAFDRAANLAAFNITRRDDGTFLHPVTHRAYAIWKAAIQWKELQQLNSRAPLRRIDDNNNEGVSNV